MKDCIKVIQGFSADFKIGDIMSEGAFLKLVLTNENISKHSASKVNLLSNEYSLKTQFLVLEYSLSFDTSTLFNFLFVGSYPAAYHCTRICPGWDCSSKQKKNIPASIYCCIAAAFYVLPDKPFETSYSRAPQWPKGYPVKI